MMGNEEYRERIIELVNQIHNNLWLKRIFTIAQHMYVKESAGKTEPET